MLHCGVDWWGESICNILPRPQDQTPSLKVHISYFLQKCKKGKSPKKDLPLLKNDITRNFIVMIGVLLRISNYCLNYRYHYWRLPSQVNPYLDNCKIISVQRHEVLKGRRTKRRPSIIFSQ